MRNSLPPLDSLRILSVCVRHENFSRAANVLGITPTAVSQRIRALEAQAAMQGIGVALLSPVLFAELTTQGALVAPFSWTLEGPNSYWLLWAKEASESHFVRWMRTQFRNSTDRVASHE